MGLLIITLFLFGFGFLVYWLTSGPVYAERKKESPVLDRKARFTLYVQGERQLMADWEAAFDPLRAELARTRHPKWPLASTHMSAHDAYLARQVYVPGGGKAGPHFPEKLGGVVWWEEMQLDRDQCKMEADAMLSHALITEREYGPRIARCNQEMQA
jgi:hypothetical protein